MKATPAKKEPIAVKNGSHGAAAKKGKDDSSSSESSEDESSDDEVNFLYVLQNASRTIYDFYFHYLCNPVDLNTLFSLSPLFYGRILKTRICQ